MDFLVDGDRGYLPFKNGYFDRPCYNAKEYESVVDMEYNKGFEGKLEM
jgi:phage pi2 protein 07